MFPSILTIEKLVFGGQGLARTPDGKVVFVWNALPGETVRVDYIKNKKDHLEATAVEIITPSPHRVVPKDTHYLSSAAWDMMSIEQEEQEKKIIAVEAYNKIANLIVSPADIVLENDRSQQYGYRNKMEFSFAEDETGTIHLAFFERGKNVRSAITDSCLANPHIMQTANHILAWVNEMHIPIRSLKSLIVRSATNATGVTETIAALFIKDKLPFSSYPTLSTPCIGLDLYYSTHKSPASVPTELLYSTGRTTLSEHILGTSLQFGLLSFFQINPPIFMRALKDIAAFLDPKMPLVDYYSGVGAIGLALAKSRSETILVESSKEAIDFAKANIEQNSITGASAFAVPAENMLEHITSTRQIIVDPPRAGLHDSVVKQLRKARPPKIIYLSCNISTQARDMRLLSESYRPIYIKLYNFFPRTPHVEGLVVLEKL